jgi:hypothetical protein
MDDFARRPAGERQTFFTEAAARKGFPPHVIEKDFWVCWTLKRLFSLKSIKGNLLFKGGTSLSKVYGLIQRFSEDIDVSIQRKSLGFTGEKDPANPELSKKASKRQDEALGEAAKSKISEDVLPDLNQVIKDQTLPEDWTLRKDDTDSDDQSLAFSYPRTAVTQDAAAYLRPSVKIEFGARSDHWPAEEKTISPYLSEALPDTLGDAQVEVKVMDARRTFWEKATILHQMAHLPDEKPFPGRYSRHYCDVADMISAQVGDQAASGDALLAAVVKHKQVFYRSAWSKYDTARRGTLRLLPPEGRISDLRKDLASMREMFFGEPPEIDSMLKILREWESNYNRV